MSRVYFHSPSGTVEVSGSERASMHGIAFGLVDGMLDNLFIDDTLYKTLHPPQNKRYSREMVWSMFRMDEVKFKVRDELFSGINVTISTASRFGSDSILFAARCDAQCEVHGWVDGKNRSWLAEIIEAALRENVLREHPDDEEHSRGWKSIIAFLRQRDDEPVVTSFSVTSQFPNLYAGGGQDYYSSVSEEECEAFYDLPRQEQWKRRLELLKRIPALEWKPETWRTDWAYAPTVLDLKEYALRTFPPENSMYDRWGEKESCTI